MKKMLLTLALLPSSLAFAAAAQDVSWKDLAPGDPIQVTLPNGATISGTLIIPRTKTPPVDFGAESAVTLDLSLEAPGVCGTMTFEKRDLRGFRRLQMKVEPNSSCDGEHVVPPAPKVEVPKPAAAKSATPKAEPVPTPQEDKDKKDKEAEELKKAIEFYNKFPPPDWGPIRHTLIIQKQARGQTPTPTEREFEEGYPALWEKGRDASQKK
jgi:hypothetical protein